MNDKMGILRRLSSKSRRKWKQLLKSKKEKPRHRKTALEREREEDKAESMNKMAKFIKENDIDFGDLTEVGRFAREKDMSIDEMVEEGFAEVEQVETDDGEKVTQVTMHLGKG